ncbi:MAG: hypothetical protein LC798_16785 [Chloroflexi bacterium]|nr:hypothetical protein [Chloroflexota bacterium]
MIEDELAIRAREKAATPGPWTIDESFEVDDKGTRATFVKGPLWWYDNYLESEADAQFIAHARTDIPALLAAVDQLRGAANWLLEQVEDAGPDLEAAVDQLRRLVPRRPAH